MRWFLRSPQPETLGESGWSGIQQEKVHLWLDTKLQPPLEDGADLEQDVFYQVFVQRVVYFPDDLFLEKMKVVQPG